MDPVIAENGAPPTTQQRKRSRPSLPRHIRMVVTGVVVVAMIGVTVFTETSFGASVLEAVGYLAYLTLAVLAPGLVIMKSALGSRGSWLADVTTGGIVGVCAQLVAWAVFTGIGVPGFLFVWPVLVVPLLVVRSTRARVLERPTETWPAWSQIVIGTLSIASAIRIVGSYFLTQDLPPFARAPYVDLPWHLGLVHEMTRAFPPHVPQAEVGFLHYSWFAHAHIASGSLITGIDPAMVMLRLWLIPFFALAILVVPVLARQLTGSVGVSVLAAAIAASVSQFPFWPEGGVVSPNIPSQSPTMLFSWPITVIFVALAISWLTAKKPTWSLFLMVALVGLVTAGSKSSAMVPLFGAAFGTAIVATILKKSRMQAWTLAGINLALAIFSLVAVSGGGYGSGVQFGHILASLNPYRIMFGKTAGTGLLPDHMLHAPDIGPWVLIGVATAMLVQVLTFLTIAFVPFLKSLRENLAAWLVAGVIAASMVFMFGMRHSGFSEVYFQIGAVPFAAVMTAWVARELVGGRTDRRDVSLLVGSAVAAGVFVWTQFTTPAGNPETNAGWRVYLQNMVVDIAAIGIGLAILAIIPIIAKRRFEAFKTVWLAVLLGSIVAGAMGTVPAAVRAVQIDFADTSTPLTRAQGQAAQWIDQHADTYDVVATNAYCRTHYEKEQECQANIYWVSGYGGHRTLLDGWAYTEDGSDGRLDDEELWELNNAIFTDPTDQSIQAVKDHGVKWVVMQNAQGAPVSDLTPWGKVTYKNDYITIYELN